MDEDKKRPGKKIKEPSSGDGLANVLSKILAESTGSKVSSLSAYNDILSN